MGREMSASERWQQLLGEWALPPSILEAAPACPWHFPVEAFTDMASEALAGDPTVTHELVAEALPDGQADLLDVGCGAGAASLAVAAKVSRIVAVDEDPAMLEAMVRLARSEQCPKVEVEIEPVTGRWPDVAGRAGRVDVAVCANVAYNVGTLGPFLRALTDAARERVVLELTANHPQTPLSPLWLRLWGLERPLRPTADDAEEVIKEVIGVVPGRRQWTLARKREDREDIPHVAWLLRRLCLPPSRERDLVAALEELPHFADPPEMVTFWWPGRAPATTARSSS